MLHLIHRSISRRSIKNLFKVLNLPTQYNVDLKNLTKNLDLLQREAHPDKGYNSSDFDM